MAFLKAMGNSRFNPTTLHNLPQPARALDFLTSILRSTHTHRTNLIVSHGIMVMSGRILSQQCWMSGGRRLSLPLLPRILI